MAAASASTTTPAGASVSSPSFLTKEEVSCLKTALVLVVAKRRFEAQIKAANDDEDPGDTTAAKTVELGPWLPATAVSVTQEEVETTHEKNWAHLDHMMRMAGEASGQRLSAIASHVASQLQTLHVSERMKTWLHSYLVELNATTVVVFQAVLKKSTRRQDLAAHMLGLLVLTVTNILDDYNRDYEVSPSSCYLLEMVESCLHVAPTHVVHGCLNHLQDYTIPMTNAGKLYWMARNLGSQDAGAHLLFRHGLCFLLTRVITALSANPGMAP